MIKESTSLNTEKTSLESSNTKPIDMHEFFRQTVEHVYLDANRTQYYKNLLVDCLNGQEKHQTIQTIETLDYLTSNYLELIESDIDDEELLRNIFEIAQKYQIEQALTLIIHWEPYIQRNLAFLLRKKVETICQVPEFREMILATPPLKYLPSENPSVLSAIRSANSTLLALNTSTSLPNEMQARIAMEINRILGLYNERALSDRDRQELENVLARLKQKNSEIGSEHRKTGEADVSSNMLSVEELLQYKVNKCEDPDCPYKPVKEKNEKFKNKDLMCPGWHFDYDKRRAVVPLAENAAAPPLAYHAKMCEKKGCRFKEKCAFSNNFFESYYHPLYYKKFSCEENLKGECDRNRYCPYVHEKEEELRWTEYIKERLGLDRNKSQKSDNGNGKIKAETEGELEAKKAIRGKETQPKTTPEAKAKEKQGVQLPSESIPESPASQNLKGFESNQLKQSTEKDLKEKASLSINAQPFPEPSKSISDTKSSKQPEGTRTEMAETNAKVAVRKNSDQGNKKTVDQTITSKTYFVEGEKLTIADTLTFHFVTNGVEIKKLNLITRSICAMLNTEGGWIFAGISEEGRVTGLPASFEEKDLLKQAIINLLQRCSPKPGNNDYSISFIEMRSQSNEVLPDRFVMKIQIKKADLKNFYCNEKEEYYYRNAEGKNIKYTPRQVQDEILRRRGVVPLNIPPVTQAKEIEANTATVRNQGSQPNQSSPLPPQMNQQASNMSYGVPPFGMNFPSTQPPPPFFGSSPQMGVPYQGPPGYFVMFVPYNPFQPNPFSQLLSMAQMPQYQQYQPSPMQIPPKETKIEEKTMKETSFESQQPSFGNTPSENSNPTGGGVFTSNVKMNTTVGKESEAIHPNQHKNNQNVGASQNNQATDAKLFQQSQARFPKGQFENNHMKHQMYFPQPEFIPMNQPGPSPTFLPENSKTFFENRTGAQPFPFKQFYSFPHNDCPCCYSKNIGATLSKGNRPL